MSKNENKWVMLDGEKVEHGNWQRLHYNGKVSEEGVYHYGKKQGKWTVYNKSGMPNLSRFYELDEEVGDTLWYWEDGRPENVENVTARLAEAIEQGKSTGKLGSYFRMDSKFLAGKGVKAVDAAPLIFKVINEPFMHESFWPAFILCRIVGGNQESLRNAFVKQLERMAGGQTKLREAEVAHLYQASSNTGVDCSAIYFDRMAHFPIVFPEQGHFARRPGEFRAPPEFDAPNLGDDPAMITWLSTPSFGEDQIERLVESLEDEKPVVRANGAFLLGYLGDRVTQYESSLAHLLKDIDAKVRTNAERALVMLGLREGPPAAPSLNMNGSLIFHENFDGFLSHSRFLYKLNNSLFIPYVSSLNVTEKGGWEIDKERFGMMEVQFGKEVTYKVHWLPLTFGSRSDSYVNRSWDPLGHSGSKLVMYLCHPVNTLTYHNYLFSFDVFDRTWTTYEREEDDFKAHVLEHTDPQEQDFKRNLSLGELKFGRMSASGELEVKDDNTPYHLDDYKVSRKKFATLKLEPSDKGLERMSSLKVSEFETRWLAGPLVYFEELPHYRPDSHDVAIEGIQEFLETNETRLREDETGKYFRPHVWVINIGEKRICLATKAIRVSHTGDKDYHAQQFCDSLLIFEMP
jgi:hypothetical protein